MAITKNIKETTKEFINRYISKDSMLPIKIEDIIYSENIKIEYRKLSDNLSGLLIIKGGSRLIGVDNTHRDERQRFTLAHELGHFVLHSGESSLFTDVQLFKRQSEGYTSREERMEQEANYFAASILMPEQIIRREANNMQCDLHDDENVGKLAEKFNVSLPAMTFRLINLGII